MYHDDESPDLFNVVDDSNRVRLQLGANVSSSDFINASKVVSFREIMNKLVLKYL